MLQPNSAREKICNALHEKIAEIPNFLAPIGNDDYLLVLKMTLIFFFPDRHNSSLQLKAQCS